MSAQEILSLAARALRGLRVMRLGTPPVARVVVFDREGEELLDGMVLAGIPHATLDVRGECIHISPRVVLRLLARVGGVRAALHKGELDGGLRGIVEIVSRSYVMACLELMRPDVVLTFIDNSTTFQWASRHLPGVAFFAIQNGSRIRPSVAEWLPLPPRSGSLISMPHFYCFSEYEPELYVEFRHDVDNFHVVGSIRADYYRTAVAPHRESRGIHDLCIVSEWEASLFEAGTPYPAIGAGLTLLYRHLGRYVSEHEYGIVVALRSDDPRESAFFRDLLGTRAQLVKADRPAMSTYAAMNDRAVIIALNSTAAREASGLGARVLFCNLTGDSGYGPPRTDRLWLVHCPEYAALRDALRPLLSLSDEEFVSRSRKASPFMMQYDPARPSYAVIAQDVRAVLEGAAA